MGPGPMTKGYVYFGDGTEVPARLLPPLPVRGKARFHDRSQNGVSVLIHRTKDDDVTIHAACKCLGIPGRKHSTLDCPLFWKRASLAHAE